MTSIDYSQLFGLLGQRAMVIGAGSGIGRESALALAAYGALLVCADRDLAAAETTAADIRATVTKHDVFRGVAQTQFSRVALR